MWLSLSHLMPSDPSSLSEPGHPAPVSGLALGRRCRVPCGGNTSPSRGCWTGGAGVGGYSLKGFLEGSGAGPALGGSACTVGQKQEGRWERGGPGLLFLHEAWRDWAFRSCPCWHPDRGGGGGTLSQSSGPPRISRSKRDSVQGMELGASGRLPGGRIVMGQSLPKWHPAQGAGPSRSMVHRPGWDLLG